MDKPDIVEFVEQTMGVQLFEYQKEVLRRVANGERILILPFLPCRSGKKVCIDGLRAYQELYGSEFERGDAL